MEAFLVPQIHLCSHASVNPSERLLQLRFGATAGERLGKQIRHQATQRLPLTFLQALHLLQDWGINIDRRSHDAR